MKKLFDPGTSGAACAALCWFALATPVHAGPRTSASYTVATDTADAGGQRATSANYTNDGSIGLVAGTSTVAAPAETAKHGYLGQLFDVTGLTLTAATLNVNEGTTDQLAAWHALDDATFLAVPSASVAWSVQSGPLTAISAAGVATAGVVPNDPRSRFALSIAPVVGQPAQRQIIFSPLVSGRTYTWLPSQASLPAVTCRSPIPPRPATSASSAPSST